MVKRDRLREIMDVKTRSGRRGGRFPSTSDLYRLKETWKNQTDSRDLLASLLPTRTVTLIEVFCRYWIQKLIDHGPPYVERAINIKTDIKYDFAMARSLHGQTISLGLVLSNSLSLSSIESIASSFSILLDEEFFKWISKVQGRLALEHEGKSAKPIIEDLAKTRSHLARLFEIRHVLVHEFPEKAPFEEVEIDIMLDAATVFMDAADEGFTQLIYGLYPINQHDINKDAQEKSDAAKADLDALVKLVAEKTGGLGNIRSSKEMGYLLLS